MKALVTGAYGFVGRHLVQALADDGWDVVAAGGPADADATVRIDITRPETLALALEQLKPDTVFHLAAQSFVPESLHAPGQTYAVNVMGTAHLAAAIRAFARRSGSMPRLLFTSSAEVYGARDATELPLTERLAPRPANPYAASKAAAEAVLLGESGAFGLDVVIARAFNHIGPGQSECFAAAAFASNLARIAAGAERVVLVGNLDSERDFLDVRDVVRAYVQLARSGRSGEIYNVCSGRAIAMRDILRELVVIAHVPVEIRNDPDRMRPSDTPISFGSNAKLVDVTGWSPRMTLAQSLRDIYADARKRAGP